jgi:enoyl-CoA hydratase/carnithine racemase
MSHETIDVRREGGVAWVTLDRPEAYNAFNEQMQDELAALWRQLRFDDEIGCVVLTGRGDRAFCTGIDRSEIPDDGVTEFDPFTWDDPGDKLGPKSNGLFTPVIAAVNGMACAGAFYLLAECDFIISADHATFFDPHVTFGMAAVYEPTIMAARMPYGEISRLSLLGSHERMSARRAYEIGLVSEVVDSDGLHACARWAAEAIASQPRRPVRATVRALWNARQLGVRNALEQAPAVLHTGTSATALEEGHELFTSGPKITPRTR